MQAATHTVLLEQAAWARVEAGKELRASTRGDLRHFVRRMLRVEGAAEWQLRAIPGIAFGCDHAIRISYCTSLDVLKEGLDRIEECLKKH